MAGMTMFHVTIDEMEDDADHVKIMVMDALVKDGLIPRDVAEAWAEHNTVIIRRKSIFRTLSDKWRKEKVEQGKMYYLVVKRQ